MYRAVRKVSLAVERSIRLRAREPSGGGGEGRDGQAASDLLFRQRSAIAIDSAIMQVRTLPNDGRSLARSL